jgi:competence protein ComEC
MRPQRAWLAALLAFATLLFASACGGTSAPRSGPGATHTAKPIHTPQPRTSSVKPTAKPTKKPAAGAPTRIVFVNVGQGDAILVKSGAHAMLVDGGPSGAAYAVAGAARKIGITRLDYVVVSHMHADHIGATSELVYDLRPARALIAGGCDGSLKSAFNASHTKITQVRRGYGFTLGSVKVKVLSPGRVSGDDPNANSVVLLLDVDGKRLLLTGDLTGPNEEAVGNVLARGPPLYVLKVAHHGSRYSTGSSFLANTQPRFAVISVGPNSYGHPTPETIARLKAAGTRIFSTQKNGTITLTIGAAGSATWHFSKSSKPVNSAGVSAGGASSGSSSSYGSALYVTATGECYHRAGCRYLAHSKIPITLKEAKAQGYRPCSVCKPPT